MPACTCLSACTCNLTVASCRRWRTAFQSTVALAFGVAAVVGLWALLGPALLAATVAAAVAVTGVAAGWETQRHRLRWPANDPDTRPPEVAAVGVDPGGEHRVLIARTPQPNLKDAREEARGA